MKTTDLFTDTVLIPPDRGSENCLEVGTRLSDFEITGILGEGGFGIVYVGFDHSLQRTVAIKEYMPGQLAGRAADQSVTVRSERHRKAFELGLNSFINEARFLAQFDHPSLVKVYRYWEQNKTAYMAMRYYEGRTIKDIVANSPALVTEAWCKFIFRQILEALEMLHSMNILHRDVSPDNIIVQKNGDAVLLDFGSARQIIGDTTKGLTVILKPGYAPVEQYCDDSTVAQGPWTDIYAVSAVLYFAIAKEAPPTSIARMVNDPILPLQQRASGNFNLAFLGAIDKGLAVLAHGRPQTIAEFRKLLGMSAFESPRRRSTERTSHGASQARTATAATTLAVAGKSPRSSACDTKPAPELPTTPARRKSTFSAARHRIRPWLRRRWIAGLIVGLIASAFLLASIAMFAFDTNLLHPGIVAPPKPAAPVTMPQYTDHALKPARPIESKRHARNHARSF